ncbi:hypothetical protein P5704_026700 (plasmid) [Pseudomonas sp. FeN3W]|nr:hypothetical protein P5704_026700 [Pseudomonas sp. FeN3W]
MSLNPLPFVKLHEHMILSCQQAVKAINNGSLSKLKKILPIESGLMRVFLNEHLGDGERQDSARLEFPGHEFNYLTEQIDEAAKYFYEQVFSLIKPKEKSVECLRVFLQCAYIDDIELISRLDTSDKLNNVYIENLDFEFFSEHLPGAIAWAIGKLCSLNQKEGATRLCDKYFSGPVFLISDDSRKILLQASELCVEGRIDQSALCLVKGKYFSEAGVLSGFKALLSNIMDEKKKKDLIELFISNAMRDPKTTAAAAIKNMKLIGVEEGIIKTCPSAKKEYLSSEFGL